MKNTFSKLALATLGLVGLPMVAFAEVAIPEASGGLETAIVAGYYISSIGFLIATIIMAIAASKYGKSALGSALSYFTVGTGVFFAVTVFQKLGGEFFGIGDESMDVWWHLMFYLALASYYFGIKALVKMGSSDTASAQVGSCKPWCVFIILALVVIFTIPKMVDPTIVAYESSAIGQFGTHHFLAFLAAFLVGAQMIFAKRNLGQIGRAIANPMIIAVWALAGQHFWELLFESWKWVDVTSEVGEGGEKIFLVITAICVISAARRLKSFAQA